MKLSEAAEIKIHDVVRCRRKGSPPITVLSVHRIQFSPGKQDGTRFTKDHFVIVGESNAGVKYTYRHWELEWANPGSMQRFIDFQALIRGDKYR